MVAIVVAGSLYRLMHEPPPDGLGSDYATIGRLIAHDAEVLEAWTLATNLGHGGDRKSEKIKENIVNLDWPEKPQGNSREAALRRLAKEASAGNEAAAAARRAVLAGGWPLADW